MDDAQMAAYVRQQETNLRFSVIQLVTDATKDTGPSRDFNEILAISSDVLAWINGTPKGATTN